MCCGINHYKSWKHHPKYHAWKKHHRHARSGFHGRWNYPPVNVQELDDKYNIYVYAAGYQKTDFKVNVEGDTLVIAASKQENSSDEFSWRRKEFKQHDFERKFELPEAVDREKITARYDDGVLEISLFKLPGHETVRSSVPVD